MELHVREVFEQDVVRLVDPGCRALKLLACQNRTMGLPERIKTFFADDESDVLHAHLVNALMDGRDELNHREYLAVEHLQLIEKDQGHRPAVPEALAIGRCVAFEQSPYSDILVPFGHPVAEVAQFI